MEYNRTPPKYDLDQVEKYLTQEYPHTMYRDFIGNILGLCRDINLNNVDADAKLKEFNGRTPARVLEYFNIPTINLPNT